VFQGNKFSQGYFAKAQVWTTISWRIAPDDAKPKQSVDLMLLFRGTFNEKIIDNGCMTNCTDKTKEDRKGKIRFCMRKEKLRNLKKDKTMQQTNMKADMLDIIEKEIDELINV
jgi:hypothetical protein